MDSSERNANRNFTPASSATTQPLLDSDSSSTPPPEYPNGWAPWSSGLFDCGADIKNCGITMWCPCITYGQISETLFENANCVSEGTIYTLLMFLPGLNCFCSTLNRLCMRQRFAFEESPCEDCLVHCFCEQCALCQEYRELKSRGFDMNIEGWRRGNMERQILEAAAEAGVEKAPTVPQSTSRMACKSD
ncbi:protein PLANT CADMIUM RESISTANCE 2-like [Telopea speciosissima]|uniref:protein PLANT CADMIUM RESISTANCE 2-like n=1 Tax=Telopea speciosissima TaxID=54955 RepID=UPI001CC42C01|nr:protein PLANT CADMIUM RESISTANCE 2-like [Telopea speciosissima]